MSDEALFVTGAAAMSLLLITGLLLLGASPLWLFLFVPHGFVFAKNNQTWRANRMKY